MKRTHLVSGATSGIGLAIARKLQDCGDKVVAVIRDKQSADRLEVGDYIIADFSSPESVRKAFNNFSVPIDSFINCAGIAVGKPIWDNTNDEIHELMNVNLISPMIAIAELKGNLKSGGALILFGSKSSQGGGWDDIYIASKGGVSAIVKSLALKMAPEIRVIGIAPGVTANTKMTKERKADDLDSVREKIPLKTLAMPEEISELVFCLLGKAGTHVTGTMIDINGGAYLR